jgi:hypothetical protein
MDENSQRGQKLFMNPKMKPKGEKQICDLFVEL